MAELYIGQHLQFGPSRPEAFSSSLTQHDNSVPCDIVREPHKPHGIRQAFWLNAFPKRNPPKQNNFGLLCPSAVTLLWTKTWLRPVPLRGS